MFATIALAAISVTPALADPQFEKLVKFLRKAENQAPYFTGILNPIPTVYFKVCPGTAVANIQIGLLKPVSFNPAGQPISGEWVEHVWLKSCSKVKQFNIHMQGEADGKPHGRVLIPGSTKTDPVLQNDAMKFVAAGAHALVAPDCKTQVVVDTLNLGAEGQPLKGAKLAPYKELWALDACGKKVQVTMHFAPDATGTTITVKPEESRAMGK